MNEKIYKFIKLIVIVLVLIIIAVSGYFIGGAIKYYLDIRKSDKAVDHFQSSLEEPYKNDTYGGKTPEETWAMFLDALKKGDVDLASKYFSVNKQKDWHKILQDTKESNRLNAIIEDLYKLRKENKDSLQQDRAYYYYPVKDEQTNKIYNNQVVFYLNPYTKVWKIVSL